MRTWSGSILAILLAACGSSHTVAPEADAGPLPDIPTAGAQQALTVGPEGGTVELGSLSLDIPAGALSEPTAITVTVDSAPPAPFTGFSPVFHFAPEGLVFAQPVTVRLPFVGNGDTATVFWTTLGGSAYAPLDTRVEGRIAVAQTTHFSSTFVGTACGDGDCCTRANGDSRRALRRGRLQLDGRRAGPARERDPAHGARLGDRRSGR